MLMWIYVIIGLSGIILGSFAGYLWAQQAGRRMMAGLREELSDNQQRLAEERGRAQATSDSAGKESAALREALEKREAQWLDLQSRISELLEERSRLQARSSHLEELMKRNLEEAAKQEERLRNEFKAMATEILKQNSTSLTEANREHLGHLLNPLREQIERFEKQVNSSQQLGTERHTELKVELERLRDLNTSLKEEANNLTRALKGDSKKQGNWGEFVL
ncbi:MAG: DNA recombination protein RmuC, partial [Bacteroidales bacterium]|nr:DNA recombination protein RmuC [Bacteroidales bacterium]